MARAPNHRYPSALALAADLERWLVDEPVSVHADPWQGRVRRWARRHPVLIGAVAAASILLMAVLASATLWLSAAHQREQGLRSEAESHERIANQERDESIRQRDAAAADFRLAQANFLRAADTEEALRKALGVAEKLTQDFADVPDYLYLRVEILILLDRYADAAEAARSAAEVKSLSAANAVSAATTLAFAAGKIALDEKLQSEDRTRRSREFADCAIAVLERCKADPFLKAATTIQHFKTDKSFDSIRQRPEFRAIVGE
jgi:hypothetical protein